jgi:hypothetical protein
MGKALWVVAALLAAWCMPASAQTCGVATNAEDSAIASTAQELVKDKPTRLDKLTALHAFVRDEIAQAKTQYG